MKLLWSYGWGSHYARVAGIYAGVYDIHVYVVLRTDIEISITHMAWWYLAGLFVKVR